MLTKAHLLVIGILFHFAFIFTIFDIYFVSPLVHGTEATEEEDGIARRLVLMVGDGLRADVCYGKMKYPGTEGDGKYLAPWLRHKIKHEGTFGISHTHVPTESRPGHVALIAGFYEDVSAVTKGWKANPVEYDSTFNRSRHVWTWGSPDILPMFVQGSPTGKISAEWYDRQLQDFTQDTRVLDTYVFDKLEKTLQEAKEDPTGELNQLLHQDKIIFFLHLLGLDTAGHASRPHSLEYYRNMEYVDENLPRVEAMINEFYGNDGKTAWIFTADHGISDWGAHGDGHPDNTRTPIIAWGAGIAGPTPEDGGRPTHDEYIREWELPVKQNDMEQADVTPLMAHLLGLSIPVNSVGKLPVDYLEAEPLVKYKALRKNVRQMIHQYVVKDAETRARQLRYRAYSFDGRSVDERLQDADAFAFDNNDPKRGLEELDRLFDHLKKSLQYLQTYNWLFLRTLVTMGFVGWMGYAATFVVHNFVTPYTMMHDNSQLANREASAARFCLYMSVIIYVGLAVILAYQKTPLRYQLYAFFPVLFWNITLTNIRYTAHGIRKWIDTSSSRPIVEAIGLLVMCVALLETMVYGYFNRQAFSLCTLLLGVWPYVHRPREFHQKHRIMGFVWLGLCIIMAGFTLLDPIKKENLLLINVSGLAMLGVGVYGYCQIFRSSVALERRRGTRRGRVGIIFQMLIQVVALLSTNMAVLSLRNKLGLPWVCQVVNWVCVIGSLVLPALHMSVLSDYRYRVTVLFLAFCPILTILCISYEGLFYVAYQALLYTWQEVEVGLYYKPLRRGSDQLELRRDDPEGALSREEVVVLPTSKESLLRLRDLRVALLFLYFFQIGFFGTGNVASISAFSLDSVYRLIPVFYPFAMTALLFFKLVIPFIVTSVYLGVINLRTKLPKLALFSMVLVMSDVLTLNFFYLIVTEGSWLEIGMSISHFFIASLLCAIMVIVEYGSMLLLWGATLPYQKTS
ncbi:GPI ethanolamine phosphate transferase [Gregarina niphandrodes]|uniref:GPI ethanolamine phosphate transferase 1 n=1 Tax=Gregarina niphandrodes TaxID=110365 RepID=A0A023BC49_GRENI|nr:GPI ethanolamine phosphate transferase [Gregarina niphandrodes]EZG81685.1 GPI ethanolamine phosphate transferase [Gregarina niphandrodes]|eukprot:XP_011134191.1 GPI ethanolamine phosphate transferase [Gregarina niphandrodes]